MTIQELCAELLPAWEHDCSGFAKAVAARLKVPLAGDADAIADLLAAGSGGWAKLPDGTAAAAAASGKLVLAGLRGDQLAKPQQHGHVVVVVPGALNRDAYPTAYWGSLGGTPGYDKTINWAWVLADLPKVRYAAHDIPA